MSNIERRIIDKDFDANKRISYEKPYILCNRCSHASVCKMKKEFLTYNLLAAKTREMVHKDGTTRFPDFDLIVKCKRYQHQWDKETVRDGNAILNGRGGPKYD